MHEIIFNCVVGLYFLVSIYSRAWFLSQTPLIQWVFVFSPLVLLLWESFFALRKLRALPNSKLPVYAQLEIGDYIRTFFILWAGHVPLASYKVLGFWVFVVVSGFLACGLITIICVELYLKREFNTLIIGCMFFVGGLFSWQYRTFVIHHDVPLVGHIFERPEYDARYYVNAVDIRTDRSMRLVADIHVKVVRETESTGEDRYGMTTYHSSSDRFIRLRRLYFSLGGSVDIDEQDESLSFDKSITVTDSRGRKWSVTLLDHYAP